MHPQIGDERDSQNYGFPEQVPCIDGRSIISLGLESFDKSVGKCYRGLAKFQERGKLMKYLSLFMEQRQSPCDMHALRSISLDMLGPTFKMSSDPRLIEYRGIPICEDSTVGC